MYRAVLHEAEKSKEKGKLIVSLIKHETFHCQRFDASFRFPSNATKIILRRNANMRLIKQSFTWSSGLACSRGAIPGVY